MESFWRAVTDDGTKPCAICGYQSWPFRKDAHHYILEQRLPDAAKVDERVGVCLCRTCHREVHSPFSDVTAPRPPLLDDFLADHSLLPSGRPIPKRRSAA